MKKPSFTEGEWSIEYNNSDHSSGGQWYSLLGPNGSDLLHFPYNSPAPKEAEVKANAVVMKAAPTLAEACEKALEALEHAWYGEPLQSLEGEAIEVLKDALKLAGYEE